MKSVVQTVLGIVIDSQVPNALQIIGLGMGTLGVLVIIMGKKA